MIAPYWSDDTITVYLGDCRDIMPSIDGAALVLADPPYGDTALRWDRWPDGWIDAIPADVAQLWCFGSMRMFLDRGNEFRRRGEHRNARRAWTYGQEVVWEKQNGSSFLSDRFKRVHEFAMHFYLGAWADLTINPQTTPDAVARQVRRKSRPPHMGNVGASEFTSIDGGPRLARSVLQVRNAHGSAIHPTEKPLGILEPLIRYSTNEGDLVIDPTAGSCSTARACRATGRRAVCIEANEEYLERAVLTLESRLAL